MSDLDFSTCDNNEEQFVLNLINEHKQRLNEIKNMKNIRLNHNFSLNKEDINNSLKTAKDYLKYHKINTSKMLSNFSSNTNKNFFHSNYLNNNNKEINNLDFKNNTQKNYYPEYNHNQYINYYQNTTIGSNNSINYNNNSGIKNKNDLNIKLQNKKNINDGRYLNNNILNGLNNIQENESYAKGENILIKSSIKLLKYQLENKEKEIKSLVLNINSLNNENKNLKQYINKLETNLYSNRNTNFNNNEFFSENSQDINSNENKNNNNLSNDGYMNTIQMQSLINKENISSINDNNKNNNNISNIDKIMNSINYFIRKMYILFNNILEKKEIFNDLNSNQNIELKMHLIKIENIINNLLKKKIDNEKFELNNKNTIESANIDNDNKFEYEYEQSLSGFNSINIGNKRDNIRINKINKKIRSKTIKKKNNQINKKNEKSLNSKIKNIKRSKSVNKINVFQRKNIKKFQNNKK